MGVERNAEYFTCILLDIHFICETLKVIVL